MGRNLYPGVMTDITKLIKVGSVNRKGYVETERQHGEGISPLVEVG
jgi:hypothetical protein